MGLHSVKRPSLSTQGERSESAGDDSLSRHAVVAKQRSDPHPNPLPVYMERGPERAKPIAPVAASSALFETPDSGLTPAGPDLLKSPVLPREEKIARLAAMDGSEVKPCTRCGLCRTRTNTVFGEGDVDAAIFFIGEGPGEDEDLQGRPFVGRAGVLLDRMIVGMGLRREQVFIANIVKCRPPGNRVPAPDEVSACTPYLLRQIEIIRPRVIVTLGLSSAKYMLTTSSTMGRLRGIWQQWRGIKLMPTYHPSYLLRSYTPENRAAVWSDLKLVMAELGMKPPGKTGQPHSEY